MISAGPLTAGQPLNKPGTSWAGCPLDIRKAGRLQRRWIDVPTAKQATAMEWSESAAPWGSYGTVSLLTRGSGSTDPDSNSRVFTMARDRAVPATTLARVGKRRDFCRLAA
jgi:hypothetical protein